MSAAELASDLAALVKEAASEVYVSTRPDVLLPEGEVQVVITYGTARREGKWTCGTCKHWHRPFDPGIPCSECFDYSQWESDD